MSITAFKNAIRHPARPTHFRVQLNFPGNDNNQIDSFFCKGASVPSATMGLVEMSYMARKAKFPGDRTYDDFQITIYNDIDFTVRKKLESWLELLNSTKGNISEDDWTKTQTDMSVFHLDGKGNVIKEYTLKNAWPNTPGEIIDLGWEQNDTPEEYTVNFTYDYWESPDTTQ